MLGLKYSWIQRGSIESHRLGKKNLQFNLRCKCTHGSLCCKAGAPWPTRRGLEHKTPHTWLSGKAAFWAFVEGIFGSFSPFQPLGPQINFILFKRMLLLGKAAFASSNHKILSCWLEGFKGWDCFVLQDLPECLQNKAWKHVGSYTAATPLDLSPDDVWLRVRRITWSTALGHSVTAWWKDSPGSLCEEPAEPQRSPWISDHSLDIPTQPHGVSVLCERQRKGGYFHPRWQDSKNAYSISV